MIGKESSSNSGQALKIAVQEVVKRDMMELLK